MGFAQYTKIETDQGLKTAEEIFNLNGVDLDLFKDEHGTIIYPRNDIMIKTPKGFKPISKLIILGYDSAKEITFKNNKHITLSLDTKIQLGTLKWMLVKDIHSGIKLINGFVIKNTKEKFTYLFDIVSEGSYPIILENGILIQ